MKQPTPGRASRRSRVVEDNSGAWGSSSQDFLRLTLSLFHESARYAKSVDGNCSIYTLAGIPMLFSALRCLLVELNAGMYGDPHKDDRILTDLANTANDIDVLLKHYPVPADLANRLKLLLELRHEILHPAHRPGAENNNTPRYLSALREARLLQSTGADTDYTWIGQLQSHRLFRWACETVKATVVVLLSAHGVERSMAEGLLASYSGYEQFDGDL